MEQCTHSSRRFIIIRNHFSLFHSPVVPSSLAPYSSLSSSDTRQVLAAFLKSRRRIFSISRLRRRESFCVTPWTHYRLTLFSSQYTRRDVKKQNARMEETRERHLHFGRDSLIQPPYTPYVLVPSEPWIPVKLQLFARHRGEFHVSFRGGSWAFVGNSVIVRGKRSRRRVNWKAGKSLEKESWRG